MPKTIDEVKEIISESKGKIKVDDNWFDPNDNDLNKEIVDYVKNTKNISEIKINIKNVIVEDSIISSIRSIIEDNITLKTLTISNFRLDKPTYIKFSKAIAAVLNTNKVLKDFSFVHMYDSEIIFEALKSNETIEKLHILSGYIKIIPAMIESLKYNKNIFNLSIDCKAVYNHKKIVKALQHNTKIIDFFGVTGNSNVLEQEINQICERNRKPLDKILNKIYETFPDGKFDEKKMNKIPYKMLDDLRNKKSEIRSFLERKYNGLSRYIKSVGYEKLEQIDVDKLYDSINEKLGESFTRYLSKGKTESDQNLHLIY